MAGRYVVHVPFAAEDEAAAWRFARIAAQMVGMLPGADAVRASVSGRDDQRLQFRLFCGRLMADGRHCQLPVEHPTPCTSIDPVPVRNRRWCGERAGSRRRIAGGGVPVV